VIPARDQFVLPTAQPEATEISSVNARPAEEAAGAAEQADPQED